MSQYPYQPPPHVPYGYGYDPYAPSGPSYAKRASVLSFVIGGLALLAGLSCTVGFQKLPFDQMMNQPGVSMPPGTSIEELKTAAMAFGVINLVAGVIYIALGAFVRAGGKAGAITAIVLNFLVIGLVLLWIGGATIVQGVMGLISGICVMGIPVVLLVWMQVWLFQAAGAAGRLSQQAQYQQYAQMQQYPQNPQAYGQHPGYPAQQPQQQWQAPGQQPGWAAPPPPPPQQQQQPQQNWPPPPPPPPASPT